MEEPILNLQSLCKYYSTGSSVVMGLNNITLLFSSGEFVAVTGESGSGKSTLSHVLCGILPYESGELLYCGSPTSQFDGAEREQYRRDAVSFISQDYGILPGCSVLENVVSALLLSGLDKTSAKVKAKEILKQVDLHTLANRRSSRLSSGQKQRLSIARALAKPSKILIADEPTGNLDAENSRQIVALLAKAAEERLVIMVTHDYDEVADTATRHIVLRDGVVVQDEKLRERNPQISKSPSPQQKKRYLSLYIALLQLRAKQGWSALLLLFFALTAFAVFSFLGSFIAALDDTPTRIYDNSAFRNGAKTRIIVARQDGNPMTEDDFSSILSIPNAVSLERYGYLADINYAYRQDIDYRLRYSMESAAEKAGTPSGITFEKTEIYAKTLPVFSDGHSLPITGRLPENLYEVIAVGSEDLIGTSIPVYIQNRQAWSTSYYIYIPATVVGVTQEGEGLYFHDDLGRVILPSIDRSQDGLPMLFVPWYQEDLTGKTQISKEMLATLNRNKNWDGNLTLHSENDTIVLNVIGTHDSSYPVQLLVSDGCFRECVPQACHNQVSLTISDYAFTDRVIDSLHELGYIAVSPFQQSSTKQNPQLAANRMKTLKICLSAFLICLGLQIFVLKSMFSVQNENYRLLSNIGLQSRTAKRNIFLQHLLLCAAGQLLGLLCIALCSYRGISQILTLTRHITFSKAALLSGIHFLGCMLSAVLVCRELSRKIYPYSAIFRDLPESEVKA